MRINQENLMKCCVHIARNCTPIDTGNMRYNAVYGYKSGKNQFKICFDDGFAYYMPYVDGHPELAYKVDGLDSARKRVGDFPDFKTFGIKGTKQSNKGFVDRAILTMLQYATAYVQGDEQIKSQFTSLITSDMRFPPTSPMINSIINRMLKDKDYALKVSKEFQENKNARSFLIRSCINMQNVGLNLNDDRYIGIFGMGYKD
jgi:hypothetical protein